MSDRAEAVRKALKHLDSSERTYKSCQREWAIAHNLYNDVMTTQPALGRRSGTELEDLRRHLIGAYEALLDAMRVHSDNHAHLRVLKGKA